MTDRELRRDELRREILDRGTQLLTRDKSNKGYICPICGSGSHKNGTGITTRDKGKHFTCWTGCFTNADIFEIVGKQYGLTDFNEQMQRCAELLGIDTGDLFEERYTGMKATQTTKTAAAPAKQMERADTKEEPKEADYTDFFLQAHKDIDKTNYHRGLSKEILDRFNVGYVADWKTPLDVYLRGGEDRTKEKWEYIPKTPRLIVPTGKGSYLARLVGDGKNPKPHIGGANRFNLGCLKTAKTPIYVVEGEIDAMSIIDCGGEAIGLGSTSMVNKFLRELENDRPTQPLIICLDNDNAGDNKVPALKDGLDKLGISHYENVPLFNGCKDANELLQKNRAELTENISELNHTFMRIEEEKQADKAAELQEELQKDSVLADIDGLFKYMQTDDTGRLIQTGLKNIDKIMQGGFVAGLYVVGAISSLGKTTFTLQIADNIAKTGRDVLFFSLEMGKYELMAKSISRLSYEESLKAAGDKRLAKTVFSLLSGKDYRSYSNDEQYVLSQAEKDYRKYAGNLYITEGIGNIGTKEVREKVERHIEATGKKPVVFIDYIQILAPADVRMSDKQAVDKNILELKRLSRDCDIPIIGISSFNRSSYLEPVNLSSFKESGAVEYGSDCLIALQYDGMDYEEGETDKDKKRISRVSKLIKEQEEKGRAGDYQSIQVKFLKQRKAPKGSTLLKFYPKFNYFEDDNAASAAEPKKEKKRL